MVVNSNISVGNSTVNTQITAGNAAISGTFTSNAMVVNSNISVGNSTAAAPAYSFQEDPDTGVYRVSADVLGFSVGGTKKAGVSASGLDVSGSVFATGLDVSGSVVATGLVVSGATTLAGTTFSGGTTIINTPAGLDLDDTLPGGLGTLEIRQATAQKDALMTFHVAGDFATYFGLDGGLNDFVIGGWSLGANKYRVWSEYNNDITGQVAYFATAVASAPSGWIKANGAAVSRTTYAALFAKIGTTYGAGDGSTTFNLPDLRGEFLRGLDDGRGVDSGRSIGSSQSNEIQSHQHQVLGPSTHSHATEFGGGTTASTFAYTPSTVNGTVGYLSTWYADNSGGSETRPRNIALLACIKY